MEVTDHPDYLPAESKLGYGDYKVIRTPKCINVLLVGRSQTGKSTIVESLLNPQRGTVSSGFSDTRDPACNALILSHEMTNASYQLTIIDTPGLKEVRKDEESRSDDELLKLVRKCVKENITSLNLVCFVSKAGETHRLDTEVFKKVKDAFGPEYSKISMMVLTHCDEFSDKKLDEFIQTIGSHEISKPYFEYCQLGIVKYGALNLVKLEAEDESLRELLVKTRLERIEKMRNNFFKTIISCSEIEVKSKRLEQILEQSNLDRRRLIDEAVANIAQEEEIRKRNEEKLKEVQSNESQSNFERLSQEIRELRIREHTPCSILLNS